VPVFINIVKCITLRLRLVLFLDLTDHKSTVVFTKFTKFTVVFSKQQNIFWSSVVSSATKQYESTASVVLSES